MSKFKIGDKVKVINGASKMYGYVGEIEGIDGEVLTIYISKHFPLLVNELDIKLCEKEEYNLTLTCEEALRKIYS